MMRLRDVLIVGGSLVGSVVASVVPAAAVAYAVVRIWFNDARVDGYAMLVVTALSVAVFVSLVAFTALTCALNVPAEKPVPFAALPWIAWAVYMTWGICRVDYITWDNWRWVLQNEPFTRGYELDWVFKGWFAIGVAGALGLIVSRALLRKSHSR